MEKTKREDWRGATWAAMSAKTSDGTSTRLAGLAGWAFLLRLRGGCVPDMGFLRAPPRRER
jgi:hypothetical protein